MSLQKLVPPPTHGYQIYRTLEGMGFKFNRREVIRLVEDMKNDIQSNYNEGQRSVSKEAKRILITGCPIGGVLDKTVKAIEEKNGVVVSFENCSGIKAMVQMVDTEAKDIVRAIGERYLQIGCAVMTPNSKRMAHLPELIREYQVDGVVEIDLQACTPYTVEAYSVRGVCEKLNVPYLPIETDYSKSDSGQLSTRLEAFLEMI
jgi:benzoyl-CoA reductase/2-hydroxyglutaryl-CoA dehydratase subunit BcrC/BadD/HgdB